MKKNAVAPPAGLADALVAETLNEISSLLGSQDFAKAVDFDALVSETCQNSGVHPLHKQVSAEFLGLSKLNWNSFDMYSKLPATLQSSGEISRIGSLLQRFGAESFDYRLFI